MVNTPTRPSETSKIFAERETENIFQDEFITTVGTDDDELTDLPGVGPSLATKLRNAGYYYIDDIQRASHAQLTEVDGIGPALADDLIDAAFESDVEDRETLTDLDGVGETTARRLRDAGISQPYELRGKSQKTIAAIDGIGEKRAARIRADVEYEAPAGASVTGYEPETDRGTTLFVESDDVAVGEFETTPDYSTNGGSIAPAPNTVSARGPERQEAIEEHAERSEEARRADESFNAPIMLDEDTWRRNKDKYDYPGVDTIPRSRKLDRARDQLATAKEMGALSSVKAETDNATQKERARGQFSPVTGIGIDTSFRKSEDTLAHEIGHAIDEDLNRPSQSGFFADEDVKEQAETLSAQRRGTDLDTEYLQSETEVFADLFAEATVNPRRAKREAPDAFRALQDEIGMDVGFF